MTQLLKASKDRPKKEFVKKLEHDLLGERMKSHHWWAWLSIPVLAIAGSLFLILQPFHSNTIVAPNDDYFLQQLHDLETDIQTLDIDTALSTIQTQLVE
ncbi:MAG: hypothetical protein HY817_02675 [Candidatus Abawacabacteria bacterium]|nr:hypothetical protein [Candidatus Abawacabacteria bacterium]